MRFSELICEDDQSSDNENESKIVTAIDLIRNRIKDSNLSYEIPIQVVLKFIQNTGIPGFNYNDLITANETMPAIKSLIKNITPDHVTFASDKEPTVNNPEDYTSSVANPEQTVSNMAKAAMKRRQK
jgi:hypothetical protein